MNKITFAVVAYNEENSINSLLDNLLSQTCPLNNIEVILVDSCSTDRTKEIMTAFKNKYINLFENIIVIDNPKKIQACGWNIVLNNYTGNIIIKVDAHANIQSNFIEKLVFDINNGENICGGKVINKPSNKTNWSYVVNDVENSMFGGSIAKFRHSKKSEYLKTILFAAYKRNVFDTVGLYNEKLHRTEDNEMHYRMRKAGYKFFYNPNIVSTRNTRSSFIKLLKQKFMNGYWVGKTLKICPGCISIYHLIPMLFVISIIIGLFFMFLYGPLLIFLILFLYSLITIIFTLSTFLHSEKKCIYYLLMPFMFFLLHTIYGIGTIIGIVLLSKN